jgi:outer membrane protein TolC
MRHRPDPFLTVAALAASLVTPGLRAGEPGAPYPLTLDDAVSRALDRNYAIAVERESYAAAAHGLRREQAAYDLELASGAGFEKRTDPVNSLFTGAPTGTVAPKLAGLDLDASVTRRLPTGGRLSVLASGARARTDGTLSLLSPAYATALGVELRQPLLRDRAIDPVRRRIRIAGSERTRSLASLKRTIADTVAAVDAAYWNLTAARRDVEVRVAAVSLAERQREETRARILAGTLPPSEEAQPRAELERRKGELLAARERAVRAENALKALILADDDDALWSARLVPSDPPETGTAPIDLAATLRAAAETRPEVDEAKAVLASTSIDLRAARDETKPRLDAYASYTRRGLAGVGNSGVEPIPGLPATVPSDLDGRLGRSLGTLADGLYPDFRVGLSFTLPIGNRAARAGAAAFEAEERRAAALLARVKQEVRVEVLNAAAAVETTAERIGAARAAREAAETQLRSEQERFGVGMSTNFLVLTRQNELSRARLDEIQALADHRRSLTELARASGSLLEERRVVVEEDAPAGGAPGGVK